MRILYHWSIYWYVWVWYQRELKFILLVHFGNIKMEQNQMMFISSAIGPTHLVLLDIKDSTLLYLTSSSGFLTRWIGPFIVTNYFFEDLAFDKNSTNVQLYGVSSHLGQPWNAGGPPLMRLLCPVKFVVDFFP